MYNNCKINAGSPYGKGAKMMYFVKYPMMQGLYGPYRESRATTYAARHHMACRVYSREGVMVSAAGITDEDRPFAKKVTNKNADPEIVKEIEDILTERG